MVFQRTKGFGERLKLARLALDYSIDDISAVLRIQAKYLRAIEANQLSSIKEIFYREQYVKSYATYVGIDWELIKKDVLNQDATESCNQKELSLLNPSSRRVLHHFELRTFIRKGAVVGTILFCLFYFTVALYHTFSPPELSLDTPLDQLTTTQEKLVVSGKTQKESTVVMINGASVPKDGTGNFKQEVILTTGLNTIYVTAAKRFSQGTTVTRQVFRQTETEQPLTMK